MPLYCWGVIDTVIPCMTRLMYGPMSLKGLITEKRTPVFVTDTLCTFTPMSYHPDVRAWNHTYSYLRTLDTAILAVVMLVQSENLSLNFLSP